MKISDQERQVLELALEITEKTGLPWLAARRLANRRLGITPPAGIQAPPKITVRPVVI